MYIVDPTRSGYPLHFDDETEAETYLAEHPYAQAIDDSQVDPELQ